MNDGDRNKLLQRMADLAASIGEHYWRILPEDHEEHPAHGIAIMGAECERIDVVGPSKAWHSTQEMAENLCRLLNLGNEVYGECWNEGRDKPVPGYEEWEG
jgi:hypothetical protein